MRVCINKTVYSSEDETISIDLTQAERKIFINNPTHKILSSYPHATGKDDVVINERLLHEASNNKLEEENQRLKQENEQLRLAQPKSIPMKEN
jgi:c-di-GMP-related signal transduction protein